MTRKVHNQLTGLEKRMKQLLSDDKPEYQMSFEYTPDVSIIDHTRNSVEQVESKTSLEVMHYVFIHCEKDALIIIDLLSLQHLHFI